MTVRSRFNTEDNYTCADVIEEQKILYSDNICIQDGFKVSQSDIASMSLKVKQGTAKIKGVSIISDAQETVNISTNSSNYPRYDLVVLEIDNTTYVATLKVIEGIPASKPQIPDIASNQLALAEVYVGSGVTSILDSNIMDVRNVFLYNSIEEALFEIVTNNSSKNTINITSEGISVAKYNGDEHNWYYVRNGFCTVSLDLSIHYWTGSTSGLIDKTVIATNLPKPISEIHSNLADFDDYAKVPQAVFIDTDGSLKLFRVHSINNKIRYSGTITYPIALAD